MLRRNLAFAAGLLLMGASGLFVLLSGGPAGAVCPYGGCTTTTTIAPPLTPGVAIHGDVSVDSANGNYGPGAQVTITVPSGVFANSSSVIVTVQQVSVGGGVAFGPVTEAVNSSGGLTFTFTGPTTPGTYLIYVQGTAPDGTAIFTEVAIVVTNPANTSGAGLANATPALAQPDAALTPSAVLAAQARAVSAINAFKAAAPAAASSAAAPNAAPRVALGPISTHHSTSSSRISLIVIAALAVVVGALGLGITGRRRAAARASGGSEG